MEICSTYNSEHPEEIVYEGKECPLCAACSEINRLNELLEDKIHEIDEHVCEKN